MEERVYKYWFYTIDYLGVEISKKLIEKFHTTKAIFEMPMERLSGIQGISSKALKSIYNSRNSYKIQKEYEDMEKKQIRFFCLEDGEYPKRLKEIKDMPRTLFVRGELPKEEEKSVAVIGARDCTNYGKNIALEIGKALAEHGANVISGMARGIDGYAQNGAANAGGKSYGVFGCGVDICYPKENYYLYQKLIETGGVISEYKPGVPARARNFPMRNRIISGLSDIIIVVEAKKRSGTSITVAQALEQGKEVMAVPGRICDVLSEGCNYLISQGAYPIYNIEEMLFDMGISKEKNEKNNKNVNYTLASELKLVYACLDFVPKSVTQVARELGGYNLEKLDELLFDLEIEDRIEQVTTGYYVRKK